MRHRGDAIERRTPAPAVEAEAEVAAGRLEHYHRRVAIELQLLRHRTKSLRRVLVNAAPRPAALDVGDASAARENDGFLHRRLATAKRAPSGEERAQVLLQDFAHLVLGQGFDHADDLRLLERSQA